MSTLLRKDRRQLVLLSLYHMGPQQELGLQSCEELTPVVRATQSVVFCYGSLSKDILFSIFPKIYWKTT